jgi:hypothetical protein
MVTNHFILSCDHTPHRLGRTARAETVNQGCKKDFDSAYLQGEKGGGQWRHPAAGVIAQSQPPPVKALELSPNYVLGPDRTQISNQVCSLSLLQFLQMS